LRAIIIFVSLALSSAIACAAETQNKIPTNFQGLWASELRFCETNHEYNLRINSQSLEFWESSGSALSIVTRDKNELALIVNFTGEGLEWIGFAHFQILSDESKLIDISDPDPKNQLVRHRCP